MLNNVTQLLCSTITTVTVRGKLSLNAHFKLLAFSVSLISSVANPNKMSAFRVWWLQTRNTSLLTGVTILGKQNKRTPPHTN